MHIVSASVRRDGLRRGKVTLAENRILRLLETLDCLIPSYTPPDVREEVQQSIVADMLAGLVCAEELTPQVVRGYVRGSYGLAWHPAFISLEHPVGDNLRLGDVLEG